MDTKRISCRKALAVVAPVPAVAALGALPARAEGPSELAALIRRYWAEVDVFNSTDHANDADSDAHAEATKSPMRLFPQGLTPWPCWSSCSARNA